MIIKKTHPKSVMMKIGNDNSYALSSFYPKLKMNDNTEESIIILQMMILNDNYVMVEIVKEEYFKGMLP